MAIKDNLQQKIEKAKKAGYSADQIQNFLRSQGVSATVSPTLTEKLTSGVTERIGQIGETVRAGAEKVIGASTTAESALELAKATGRGTLDVAGAILSPITSVLETSLEGYGKTFPGVKDVLQKGIEIGGESLATVLDKIPGYSEYIRNYPEAEKDFERILNAIALKGLVKPGATAVKAVKEKVTGFVDELPPPGDLIKRGKQLIEPIKTPEKALGEITQGKLRETKPVKNALEDLSSKGKLEGVETFENLQGKIKEEIPELARGVDSELAKDTGVYKPAELLIEGKTKGGQIVKTDYVNRALRDLAELYKTTGDAVSEGNIKEIITKAEETGLTRQEVNNISRTYGQEFSEKAFSKVGDPLTSVNAQAFENTRTGLKQVARKGLGGTEAQALDAKLSDYYDTQRLIQKNVEAVNKLRQRIQERGLIEKVGYTLAKYADLLSGGSIRGFVGGLLPRGAGYKVMNALDIESALRKNLDVIEKALKENTDAGLVKILESDIKKSTK